MGLQGVFDGSGFTLFRSLFRFQTIFKKNPVILAVCDWEPLQFYFSQKNPDWKKLSLWVEKVVLILSEKNCHSLTHDSQSESVTQSILIEIFHTMVRV